MGAHGVEEGDEVLLEASRSVAGAGGRDGEDEVAEGPAGGGYGGEGGRREVGEDQRGPREKVGFAGPLHFSFAERNRTRLGGNFRAQRARASHGIWPSKEDDDGFFFCFLIRNPGEDSFY